MFFHVASHEGKLDGLFGGKGRNRNEYAKGKPGGKAFDTMDHVGLLEQKDARSREGQGPTEGQRVNIYHKNRKGEDVNRQ